MKVIFKVDGANLTAEKPADYTPQIGWTVIRHGRSYLIEDIELDLDSEEQQIFVHLKQVKTNGKKEIRCSEVWGQSHDSLSVNKVYEIIKENETYFYILDDKGKKKRYKHGNTQFIRI